MRKYVQLSREKTILKFLPFSITQINYLQCKEKDSDNVRV